MAEVLLKEALKRRGVEDVEVSSAGVSAQADQPASHNAVQAMKEMGLNLKDHRARPLDEVDLSGALALCMTDKHVLLTQLIKPGADARLLGEYAGVGGEIPDPYGGSIDQYRKTARALHDAAEKIAERILTEI